MRCPKCGYISFDQQEKCPGCKKDISKFSQEFAGIVFRSNVPDFLNFGVEKEPEEAEEDVAVDMADAEEEIAVPDMENSEDAAGMESADAGAVELGEDVVEFSADAELPELDAAASGQELELNLTEEATKEEEKKEIEFDVPQPAEQKKGQTAPGKGAVEPDAGSLDLGLDLGLDNDAGGLNLSLENADKGGGADKNKKSAPQKAAKQASNASLLDMDMPDIADLMSSAPAPAKKKEPQQKEKPQPTPAKAGESKPEKKKTGGLPDLDLDLGGIDLAATGQVPAGGAAGKKLKPTATAAKTGTALDDFNIDLGDLLGGSGKKKKK